MTTKIHALVDAKGRPIQPKLMAGQKSDDASGPDMIATLLEGAMFLSDKGHDANALRVELARQPGLAGLTVWEDWTR